MNKCIIIGNLTRAPERNETQDGIAVCNFTVAVNRRTRADHPEADYFRVTAWRELGENCARFLDKGRKVMACGAVSARAYVDKNGQARATMELTADELEFLSPQGNGSREPSGGNDR